MKKIFQLILLGCSIWLLAQTKPAATNTPGTASSASKPVPPSKDEILAMKKIMVSLQKHFNILNDSFPAEIRKQSTAQLMKENLSTITRAAASPLIETIFWNDLDTSLYAEISPLVYGQKNSTRLYHSFDTTAMKIGHVEYDPWRRISLCEIQTLKTISWWSYDNISRFDSLSMKDTIVPIPFMKKRTVAQSLFFKFVKDPSGKTLVKILYIGEQGKKPKLAELPPLQTWWRDLDPTWKKHLSKNKPMEEYPKESDLSKLTYITEMDLSKSTFTDFTPIAVFTNLEKLNLSDSKFNDLKILQRMQSLKILDVSRSLVRSLDSIQTLKRLEEFTCIKNEITDISKLNGMKQLLKIDFSENDIEDLRSIASLENLKELHLSLNLKIKDLSPIANLIYLEKLSLRKIDLSNMNYLAKLNSLVYLDLYASGITDLTPIGYMKKLFYLDISGNKFTSLESIRGLKFITHLYVNNSSMVSLEPAYNFIYLQELDVSNCPQIKTLGAIEKISSVRVLKAISTGIGKEEIARFKKSHPNAQIWYY